MVASGCRGLWPPCSLVCQAQISLRSDHDCGHLFCSERVSWFPHALVSGCDIPEFRSHTLGQGVSRYRLHNKKKHRAGHCFFPFLLKKKKIICICPFLKITKIGHREKNWVIHEGIKYQIYFYCPPSTRPSLPPTPQLSSWIVYIYCLATQSKGKWPEAPASPGSLLERQSFRHHPGLLNQNLHFKIPQVNLLHIEVWRVSFLWIEEKGKFISSPFTQEGLDFESPNAVAGGG